MSLKSATGQLRKQRITLPERRPTAHPLLPNPALRSQRVAGLTKWRTHLTEWGHIPISTLRVLRLVVLRHDRIQQRIL